MPKGKQFWKFDAKPRSKDQTEYFKRINQSYWRKKCSLCDRKALYRAGKHAYCAGHRSLAVEYWTNHPLRVLNTLHLEG